VTTEPITDELRWLARIKELEWRADLARLVLAGDTAALSERLAQGPNGGDSDEYDARGELCTDCWFERRRALLEELR